MQVSAGVAVATGGNWLICKWFRLRPRRKVRTDIMSREYREGVSAGVPGDAGSEGKVHVLVSACLLGVHCRYNGKGVLDDGVLGLMQDAELVPVCPEVLGGLATPRQPAERVGDRVVTVDGVDVTAQYQRGAEETLHLARLYDCPCAVLKERSPSCGCGVVYDGTHTGCLTEGDGVTAEVLKAEGIRVFGESRTLECRTFLEIIKGETDRMENQTNPEK